MSSSTADIQRDLPYAPGGALQSLDLYLPKGKTGEPLLIFIHGGAWLGGDKAEFSPLAERLVSDGIAVALINYRLSRDPAIKNPAHVKDASLAYAWLAKQSGKYGYDATKIFVSGHSAGAHNAAMMATGTFLQDAGVPAANMPAGFIGMEGIYDIAALNKKFPTYRDWFLVKAMGPESDWAASSPSERPVKLKTPWLIIQSTQDSLVNVPQAEGLAAHLKKAGVKVDLWIKPDGDHDQVVRSLSNKDNEAAKKILEFVTPKKLPNFP